MSYFSYSEDQSLGGSLGCGPSCKCGPCRSGMSGFAERYEKEQNEPVAAPPPKAPPRPTAASRPSGSLQGWRGLGYAEVPTSVGPTVVPTPVLTGEQAVLQDALRRGISNPRRLANIIFFTRHPARVDTPILANEVGLIDEWRQILQRIVLPALQQPLGPQNNSVVPLRVRPRRRQSY